MPEVRPLNTAYDGHFGILTLAEVIELARRRSTAERPIRVLAELKYTASADEQACRWPNWSPRSSAGST